VTQLLEIPDVDTFMIKRSILMIKTPQSPILAPAIVALLEGVRALYGAIERFDVHTASALCVDRTCVRAINVMERGPVSPGHLGATLGLTSGAVTALLQRLEHAGHIRRVDTTDGRRRDAQLTSAGRRAAHREFAQLGDTIAAHFADRAPAQVAEAADALKRLAAAFETAAAKPSTPGQRAV
jgi:DNA-binding MarR family transcriptional regulator